MSLCLIVGHQQKLKASLVFESPSPCTTSRTCLKQGNSSGRNLLAKRWVFKSIIHRWNLISQCRADTWLLVKKRYINGFDLTLYEVLWMLHIRWQSRWTTFSHQTRDSRRRPAPRLPSVECEYSFLAHQHLTFNCSLNSPTNFQMLHNYYLFPPIVWH